MDNLNRISGEEKPLIEFPTLVRIFVVIISTVVGVSFFFVSPWIVLFLFIGVCASIAVFFNLYVGIFVFLVGAFFHPTYWIPALQAYHPARYLAFGVLFIWGFHTIIYRDFHLVKVPQNCFILIFMALAFLSTLRNLDSVLPFFLDFGVKAMVLYFAISNLVKTRKQAIGLIWALVVINVILCLIGFYQYAHGIGEVYADEGILRIRSLADESNMFAMDLTIALPLAIGLFYAYKKSPFLKLVLGLIISLLVLTTIFTFSRAGFLQLVIVFLLSFWWRYFKKKKIVAIMLGIVVILAAIPVLPAKYWERAQRITDFSDPSINRRLVGMSTGIGMMFEHPFQGVGFGTFRFAFIEYAIEHGYFGRPHYSIPTDAHNAYIQTGAELGIFGLAFLLLLIIWTFKYLKEAVKTFRKRNMLLLAELSSALQISLLVYLIASIFLSLLHMLIFWILISLGVVMHQLALQYETSEILDHNRN